FPLPPSAPVAFWPRRWNGNVVIRRARKNNGCGNVFPQPLFFATAPNPRWRTSVRRRRADFPKRRIIEGEVRLLRLVRNTTEFLAIAFAGQRRFQAAFFTGWNIEGVSFDFADNIFLLHFTLEPAESAFQRLVITEFDFCH